MSITLENSDKTTVRIHKDLKQCLKIIENREYRSLTSMINEALNDFCSKKGVTKAEINTSAQLEGLEEFSK